MHALSDDALLTLWERGATRTPAWRALEVLRCASVDEPGSLPAGRRDAALLDVHAATFGPVLQAVTECPTCAEQLEVVVPADGSVATGPGGPDEGVTVDGYRLRFHPPSAAELAALPAHVAASAAADVLFAACVDAVTRAGEPVDPAALPPAVRDTVETAMAERDPAAETRLTLSCPACGRGWSELLDPATFVWSQVETAVGRLADEVHALAASYGWSEHEIVAMSPVRRRLYLQRQEGVGP